MLCLVWEGLCVLVVQLAIVAEFFLLFVQPCTTISYLGTGSGAGRKAVIDGKNEWGLSDAAASNSEATQAPDLLVAPL
jgi:hypothetical protein